MRQEVRHQLWIVAIGAVLFFANLGATRLWDQDEAFFTRTAVEMHQRGEWVVPYFNDELFAHKPPFMYWMMRIGFQLFGVTEFGARFWSAAFGVATALLVYRLGKRLFNPRVGLWAAMAMSSALMFDVVGRAATPDSYLVFFCTLALYIFARSENWNAGASTIESQTAATSLPLRMCIAMYAAMGFAVLVKGPIGMLLPGGAIGLYLLVRDEIDKLPSESTWSDRVTLFLRRFTPPRVLGAMWRMRPFTAIAMVLLIAGPWFALVGWRTHGDFLREFFGVQNYGRFVEAMDSHSGAVWYYVPAILAGFFPWSIFGIPTTLELVRRCRDAADSSRGAKFLACWIVGIVGFFSIAGTKLPSYVLPAFPALALATACLIERWLSRPEAVRRWWPRLSFGSLLVVGVIMAAAAPLIAHSKLHGQPLLEKLGASPEAAADFWLIGWVGAILVVGGAVGIVLSEFQLVKAALIGLAVTAPAFSIGLFSVAAVQFDRHQPTPMVANAIRQHAEGTPHVGQFGYLQPSLVYYTNTHVEACKNVNRLVDFLNESTDAFIVTTAEHYGKIAARLPADVVVIDRQPDFPQAGTILVLGHSTAVAQRSQASPH